MFSTVHMGWDADVEILREVVSVAGSGSKAGMWEINNDLQQYCGNAY